MGSQLSYALCRTPWHVQLVDTKVSSSVFGRTSAATLGDLQDRYRGLEESPDEHGAKAYNKDIAIAEAWEARLSPHWRSMSLPRVFS